MSSNIDIEELRKILTAPMRSEISTADMAIVMSSTCLAEKLFDLDKFIQQKVIEARRNELTTTYTQVIGDKDAPLRSKVTKIFTKYLKLRVAELQAQLNHNKKGDSDE